MTSVEARIVLPPYRRSPDDYRCFECSAPATGIDRTIGMVLFYCDEHKSAANTLLWEKYADRNGWSVSQDGLRKDWPYYVASFWWRFVNLRHLRAQRQSARVVRGVLYTLPHEE